MPEWPSLGITGVVEVTDAPIAFDPVPRIRRRRNGWTPETRADLIEALSRCGSVSRAAKAVGMTSRSGYRLPDAEGVDSFAAAWDHAIARGIERLREDALDRALNGAWVPVYRRAKVVRMEHRINDRLGIALLSGRESSVAERREQAASRRRYRQQLLAKQEHDRIKREVEEAIWAEQQSVLDRIEEERENPRPMYERRPPRIVRL